jgi:hypothetical protein
MPDQHLPEIDFNTFVLSLSTSALMHLDEPDLVLAKQTIDILALIEQKTRGNLDGEEERLLAQILTDLRMRYVAKAKEAPAAEANEDPTNPG